MGKKNPHKKGKAIVMTQAEFFSSQGNPAALGQTSSKSDTIQSDWDKGDIFKARASTGKLVVAGKVEEEKKQEVKKQEDVPQEVAKPSPTPVEQVKTPEVQQKKPEEAEFVVVEERKTKTKKEHKQEPVKKQPPPKQVNPQQQKQSQPPKTQTKVTQPVQPPAFRPPMSTMPPPPMPQPYQMPMPMPFGQGYQGFMPQQVPFQQPGQPPLYQQHPAMQIHPAMRMVQQQAQPPVIPREVKPDTYEDAMKLFEHKSQVEQKVKDQKKKKSTAHKKKLEEEIDPYGDEYYGEEEFDDDEYGFEADQFDPDMLQSLQAMLSGMAQNPHIQASLNPNQLSMLMDPNSLNQIQNFIQTGMHQGFPSVYQPPMMMPQQQQFMPPQGFMMPPQPMPGQLFNQLPPQQVHPAAQKIRVDYDPEVDNIDDIIHAQDPFAEADDADVPKSRFHQLKEKNKVFGAITKKELEEMSDDDAIIELFLQNPDRFTVCEFYKRGTCRYGDNCKFHHPPDIQQKEDYDYSNEPDEECCICLEKVLANNRQFGVLDNCDHTFCLKCIRGWRSTYDKRNSKHHFRTCPICRRNSYLVVPSDQLIKSGPEKDELIEEYKEVLKQIPCRHFNRGKGQCPFMNSCLYSHILPNGTPYEYPWRDNKINEEGEWEDDYEPTLAERFGNLNF